MIEKVTSGSRWRGLESDLFSQRSGSASHRRRWTGPKDGCLGIKHCASPRPYMEGHFDAVISVGLGAYQASASGGL
jgi:hypothetical protein